MTVWPSADAPSDSLVYLVALMPSHGGTHCSEASRADSGQCCRGVLRRHEKHYLRPGDTYSSENTPTLINFPSVNALRDYFAVDWTERIFLPFTAFPKCVRNP